jgi:hypothetical protein
VQAAPIVNSEGVELGGNPLVVRENLIRSASPNLMQTFHDKLIFTRNRYEYHGTENPYWNWNGKTWRSFQELQAAGAEKESELHIEATPLDGESKRQVPTPKFAARDLTALPGLDGRHLPAAVLAKYRLVTWLDLKFDSDGLIAPEVMARLDVLRTLAREYSPQQLQIVVLVPHSQSAQALRNALLDLDAPSIRFEHAPSQMQGMLTSLIDSSDGIVAQWEAGSSDFNAATIGYAVRRQLGVPVYAQMDTRP